MSHPKSDLGGNVFIAGATRGGKTVTGNELHAEFAGLSIFFNSEEEPNVVGYRIRSPGEIIKAVKSVGWNAKLDYVPAGIDKESMGTELAVVQSLLFRLADTTGRKKPIQIVVDECQDYAEQGHSEGPLHVLMRKGLKRKIRVVAMSQDPARVSKTVVRQCYYNIWCGPAGAYYEPYFKTYRIPHESLENLGQGDYHVFDISMNCLSSSPMRANSRYA